MKLQVKAMVEVPAVPNFLLCRGEIKIPVEDITDEEASQIGDAWKLKFIQHVIKRREEKATALEGPKE